MSRIIKIKISGKEYNLNNYWKPILKTDWLTEDIQDRIFTYEFKKQLKKRNSQIAQRKRREREKFEKYYK